MQMSSAQLADYRQQKYSSFLLGILSQQGEVELCDLSTYWADLVCKECGHAIRIIFFTYDIVQNARQ